MSGDSAEETRSAFSEAVNMTAGELRKWLDSAESKSVGVAAGEKKDSPGGSESVGHESGRRIVDILGRRKDDLGEEDLAHMRKVVGYVHRHLAQRPEHELIETSRWRYSLMNWGHDPLKD